jgi:nitrile hydratase
VTDAEGWTGTDPVAAPDAHDGGDGHDHDVAPAPAVERRVVAMEALLVEMGLITTDAVDAVVELYEDDVGPMNGAKVVARAWVDAGYRERLLADGTAAIAELGFGGVEAEHLVVLENTPAVHNVVVCTLCSCYPWAVLGLPPRWYKSFAYRSRVVREPRAVLAEFGTVLPEKVEVRVWDSSAELRYLVLPLRPEGTGHCTEAELADRVTRDHMIGVAR